MDIPLNTPICLKAHTGNNLQNVFGSRLGCCVNRNTQGWEQLELIKCEDGKIIIQSRWNGRNLQVQECGKCVFANHNQGLWEKFDVETDKDGKVYFTSCHTGNVMQCDENGFARCVNKNRLEWEAWTIINPNSCSIMTSGQLRNIVFPVVGVVCVPLLGLTAGAMVPLAMASFGTVVAGVGTFHAPLIAGGVAAILQASSTTLFTVNAAVVGGIAGGVISNALPSK